MSSNRAKLIVSLQALRALAFLGIFLGHAGAPTVQWPALGVSIFYVLSGYLMYYRYENQDMSCSIKQNAFFSWNKIKKLYPLHILTMCCAVALDLAYSIHQGITVRYIVGLIGKVGLNVTLLQTWVPYSDINVSLNGVAWYLSVTMFLYFMFPYVKKWIKNKKNNTLMLFSIAIIVAEVIICVPWIILLGSESKIYIWFMYCFPVFRLGDFFIGCCFGKCLNKEQLKKDTFVRASIYEVLATILTVVVFVWTNQKFKMPLLLATKNLTTPYIPLAVIWVLLFTKNQGIITKLLTNKVTIFVGNISAYTFLIHYIFMQYFSSAISFLNLDLSYCENIIKIYIELILSIGIAFIYQKISLFCTKKQYRG